MTSPSDPFGPDPAKTEQGFESPNALASLQAIVADELRLPVAADVEWLAEQIAASHGDTVLGVLFYGSCLRQDSADGILDFWIVVEDYRAAYSRGWHSRINHIAPPNQPQDRANFLQQLKNSRQLGQWRNTAVAMNVMNAAHAAAIGTREELFNQILTAAPFPGFP